MINNVLNFPQAPDLSQIKPAPDVPAEIPAGSGSDKSKNETGSDLSRGGGQDQTPAYQLRLTVDRDPETGDWVYKAIDRYTGEVVRQLPRQDLLEMRKSTSYQSGSVIKTDI
jgi:flagellar protein FlaG